MKLIFFFALFLAISFGVPALAQQWASDMFEAKTHDFGNVARGAKAEFEFKLTNPYLEDVHIASVSSSCGCTSPSITKPILKTYESGSIIAHINTDRFLGSKGATITVTIDKPYPSTVHLSVQAYIRSDVVFNPGSVNFGEVDQGKSADKTVTLNYAGRSDWKVQEVRCDNPHVQAQVQETSRQPGQVAYQVSVHVDENTPAGYLNEHLVLVTNDYRLKQVPLAVEGRIVSGVSVSPSTLFMGVVEPGQKVQKKLVVRAKKPFRILSIHCPDGSFEFDSNATKEAKTLHLVPVTFVAGKKPGKISQKIEIETDLGTATSELPALAVVTAETPHQ
ncbi:MAG: DUF1573 domain-containing protein [Pirellulales bacterium]|nr:DUF1573 domain-containing protein [Pirellulales bacterium]